MTDPQVAMLMLSLFIFLVLLGFPIAFTLIAMGVGFGYYAYFQADNLFNNQIFYLLNQNKIKPAFLEKRKIYRVLNRSMPVL